MARRGRKTKASPPSNVSNETIADFIGEAIQARAKLETATGELRAVFKRAKAAGCDNGAIRAIMKMRKQDTDEVRLRQRNIIRYAHIYEMPLTQVDLFEDLDLGGLDEKAQRQKDAMEVTEAGFNAGKNGVPVDDNPHDAGEELYVFWRNGWGDGKKASDAALNEGETVAPARKRKNRGADASTISPDAQALAALEKSAERLSGSALN